MTADPATGAAPVRVFHVITGMARAGAEMVLLRLLEAGDRERVRPVGVASLTGEGPLADPIRALDVPLAILDIRQPARLPQTLARLRGSIAAARPDVVQTWMYHGDLVGGLAARAAGVRPIVWGLHATTRPPGGARLATRVGVAAAARLSYRLPSRIIACAESARDVHVDLGYDPRRMVVIPNGFDVPPPFSSGARAKARKRLRIPGDRMVVVRLARYHPQKDHPTFVAAAAQLVAAGVDVHFVLAGLDVTDANADLAALLGTHAIADRVTLLGLHSNSAELLAAADVAVSSSSYGEAFPLVIGEAMAHSVPVVTTDIGDSARMLGADAGRVVPARRPDALARALEAILRATPEQRAAWGGAGRDRIAREFSLPTMVARYEAVHREVAGRPIDG